MNLGKFKRMFLYGLLTIFAMLLTGCDIDLNGPQYTKDSLVTTLKEYGITAHYPIDQGTGQLLRNASGTHYLLEIDYIDQYLVKDGWAEVYIYSDAKTAYEEALLVRKEFEAQLHYDQKVADLQGRKLEVSSLPLFQHGNVILYGGGIAKQEDAMERVTKTFGRYQK